MSSNTVPPRNERPDSVYYTEYMYGNYRPNPYVERMFCFYCMQCKQQDISGLCSECGTKLFGMNTINAYTPKIPARDYYDYQSPKLYGTNGRFLPNMMPYGSYHGRYYNRN